MPRLAGQVAIVTGRAMGIGGATGRRLAEDGALVLIADIEETATARNVDAVCAAGGTAEALVGDIGTRHSVRGMVEHAVDLWDRLDIVVTNAYAGTLRGAVVAVSEED